MGEAAAEESEVPVLLRWVFGPLICLAWAAGAWGAGVTCLRGGIQAEAHGTNFAAWTPHPLGAWAVIGLGTLGLGALTLLGCEQWLSRRARQQVTAAAIGVLVVIDVVFVLAAIAAVSPLRSALSLPAAWLVPGASWATSLWLYLPAVAAPLLGVIVLLATYLARMSGAQLRTMAWLAAAVTCAAWLAIVIGYPPLIAWAAGG